jgi:PAS domain S-box-containing protein
MTSPEILIVEDEALIAAQLQHTLTGAGYRVLPPVSTGEEALVVVEKNQPDLILMDIQLAGDMDGIRTAEKISRISDIPVIYITAYSDEELLTQAQLTEPYGYLVKPVETRELIASIRMVLYKHNISRKLRESEERYRTVFTQAREIIILIDTATRRIVDGNHAFETTLGYAQEDFKHLTLYDLIYLPPPGIDEWCTRVWKEKNIFLGENQFRTKNNTLILAEVSASLLPGPEHSTLICVIAHDVTLRRRAEEQMALAARLFRILNDSSSSDLIRRILIEFKNSTGIEAVGIRLHKGGDYPYYETSGFPDSFIDKERYLCVYNSEGNPECDSQGSVILECMCGNIISGRVSSDSPYFTPSGSFWTNSTSELLASVPRTELGDRMRLRCNTEGYESVALIPLRCQDSIIGLLQFNDHRKNIFSLPVIEFFEGLGNSIGIALERKNFEDSLRIKNLAYHSLKKSIILSDLCGNISSVNTAALSLLGWPDEQSLIGMPVTSLWPDQVSGHRILEIIKSEGTWSGEITGSRKDGTQILFQLSADLIRNPSGLPVGIVYLVQNSG